MTRWVLGLNLHHDASACLTRDGVPVVALAQERLCRRKHAPYVTDALVDYCLDAAGICAEDLELVVLTSIWLPGFLSDDPDGLWEWYEGVVARQFGTGFRLASLKPPVAVLSHHLAHAYAVFGSSGWDDAAVLVVDWAGSCRMDLSHPEERRFVDSLDRSCERERVSLYHFGSDRFRVVEKQFSFGVEDLNDYGLPLALSGGIGGLYEVVGQFLFGNMFMAGKVMGLAPYGRPEYGSLGGSNGSSSYRADISAVRQLIGHRTNPSDPLAYADLAASAQETLEAEVFDLVERLHDQTGSRRLAYSGGVALNCVLNAKLERDGPFEDLFVLPASNDTGAALGAALYGNRILGVTGTYVHRSDYLGREYGTDEMEAALREELPLVSWERLGDDDLIDAVAQLLADGKVVGWFQGGSELGPRALGNRSILADPRDPNMKDLLNKKVKHREPFRPFGPLVLADRAEEVFDVKTERRFMLHADVVTEAWRNRIPSAVHVDGSARIQTVSAESNPRLFALLTAFDRLTGVPVLINTSLNVRGEPIVERPAEAVDILRMGKLDALALGNLLAKVAPLAFDADEVRVLVPRWRARVQVIARARAKGGALRVESKEVAVANRPSSRLHVPLDGRLDQLVDGTRTVAEILDGDAAGRAYLQAELDELLRLGLLELRPASQS